MACTHGLFSDGALEFEAATASADEEQMQMLATDGPVNHMLGWFGPEPTRFIQEPEWFRTIYVTSEAWQTVGWGTILYLAALTTIDDQIGSGEGGRSLGSPVAGRGIGGTPHAGGFLTLRVGRRRGSTRASAPRSGAASCAAGGATWTPKPTCS